MTNQDYVSTEVSKIIQDKEMPFPRNYAMSAAWIAGNFKGINLKVLDLTQTSVLADYFVLTSATNITQAKAMSDEILRQFRNNGYKVISREGRTDSDWILLDFGDVIIHIFLESSRMVYGLDSLWSKAKSITIPNHYYFSAPGENGEKFVEVKDKEYF